MEGPGAAAAAVGAGPGGSNVSAFLTKLWTLVEDPETDPLICWSPVRAVGAAPPLRASLRSPLSGPRLRELAVNYPAEPFPRGVRRGGEAYTALGLLRAGLGGVPGGRGAFCVWLRPSWGGGGLSGRGGAFSAVGCALRCFRVVCFAGLKGERPGLKREGLNALQVILL